jgi:hypothetical protein
VVSFDNTPTPTVGVPTGGDTAVPPTAVSLPSVAPTTGLNDACNSVTFEGDITIPDGTVIKPGTNFQKIWAIRNTGNCKWDDGYALVYVAGSTPDLDPYTFEFKKASDFVGPGQGINIAINLTAPCKPGKYEGHWKMRSDQGFYFGDYLSVYIEVKGSC